MTSLSRTIEILKKDLSQVSILIGHGIQSDLDFLSGRIPNVSNLVTIMDSQHVCMGWFDHHQPMSVQRLCEYFKIPPKALHNAGNDSRYAMECVLQCCARPSP